MEKKTLYALVAFAVLGLGAIFVMRAPEKGQRVGPRPRPVAELKGADVTGLEITTEKQEKVSLEKADGKWRVKTPSDWAADQAAVKQLTDALEKLSFADMVTEATAKHEELGVADGKAQRLTAKGAGGKVLADLLVGKSVGGFVMLRPAGKNEVWQGTGLFPYQINKDGKAWRDHVIFEFAANDASALTVEAGAAALAVEKMEEKGEDGKPKPGEAKWKVAKSSGDAPKTSEALDGAQVNQTVLALSNLRATDFADDKKATEVGLEPPALTLTATAAGKAHRVLVGKIIDDDVYVRSDAAPTIYTVKKYSMERLMYRPIDFRDKTLIKAKEVDIAAIEIVNGADSIAVERDGEKWKRRGAGTAVDDAKVKPVAGGFESLTGSRFAADKAAFGKQAGSVTVRLRDKSASTLRIGALTKDSVEYHVQKVGSPDVMLVKKYAIDRVFKKPSDLEGAPKTANAGKK